MTSQALSLDCSDETSPSEQHSAEIKTLPFVVLKAEALSELSDSALDDYIVSCAEQCNSAHARYKASGCFADAGDRDRWWTAEAAALVERGSRPNVVARMEQERGLA